MVLRAVVTCGRRSHLRGPASFVSVAVRSHVDLCTFVRFIHFEQHEISEEVRQHLSDRDPSSQLRAFESQCAYDSKTWFHELYHYWQGLRLPFLHRYAVLTFPRVFRVFKELSRTHLDLHRWQVYLPEFEHLNQKYQLWLRGDRIIVGGINATSTEYGDPDYMITCLDLLETAASLAEFQAFSSKSERVDVRAFRRWMKRRSTYRAAFDCVALNLRDEQLALRCTLPLVNAAFHTSNPVAGFSAILTKMSVGLRTSEMVTAFVAQEEPCRWTQFFQFILDQVDFESSDEEGLIINDPFRRLRLDDWIGTSYGAAHNTHPFLNEPAKAWAQRVEIDPDGPFSWVLDQPGWLDSSQIREVINTFRPLTLARFHLPDGDGALVTTGDDVDMEVARAVLTIYSVIRRASGAHFDPDNRTCHHVSCPEYGENYCNSYPAIPVNFEQCGFRRRAEALRERAANLPEVDDG